MRVGLSDKIPLQNMQKAVRKKIVRNIRQFLCMQNSNKIFPKATPNLREFLIHA